MKYREIYLSELAKIANSDYIGNDVLINGLGLCNRKTAYESILAYIDSVDFLQKAAENRHVKALVATRHIAEQAPKNRFGFIVCDYPEETFYNIHLALYESNEFYEKYDFKPIIGHNCKIHPSAVIENGVKIGNKVQIGSCSVINSGTIIEDNVCIGNNNTIGANGFQIIHINGKPSLIPHVGQVKIQSGGSIRDNNTIHKSLFEGFTKIGENVKIDSQCYIAHNCIIEENAIMTAGVRMMGSSIVQKNCWIAPNTVILNRVVVESNTMIGTMSLVNKSTAENSVYLGIPARKIRSKKS
jgi:UDP-3-O-[3-hydroxymyristoyl] glucosamine N-acyltransferase